MRRIGYVLVSVVALGAVARMQPAALQRIELPATISFPEGIAYDAAAGALYTGGAADGALIRVDAKSGATQIVAPAGRLVPAQSTTFPTVLGMELDSQRRLWVAGGLTGKVWVVDAASGKVVRDQAVPTVGRSLLNDVALVGGAAYVTDTFVPTLWRASAEGGTVGDLQPWLDLSTTAIPSVKGPNLNGITATADGKQLIVVHMSEGKLFTVDPQSKAVKPIDTAGADLTGADGLEVDGDTLYLVRQPAAEIVSLRLSADLARATVIARLKDPLLAWPATAVRVGRELIVVNSQFNMRPTNGATRPFTLLRVPFARLGTK